MIDFSDPKTLVLALAKLRGDISGKPFLWWYAGEQYAVVDMTSTVLFAVEGAQIGRFVRKDDGAFDHTFRDVMFYKDAKTGERLRKFTNPIDGKIHEPPVARMGPFTIATSADGSVINQPSQLPPGMSTQWMLEPPVIRGDDIYIRETGSTRIAKPGKETAPEAERFHHINDFLLHYGHISYVRDPNVTSAPARQSYQSANDWTPWMKMGNRPGFVLGRGIGTKLAGPEELPKHMRDWIAADEPTFLQDPELAPWDKSYTPVNQPDRE